MSLGKKPRHQMNEIASSSVEFTISPQEYDSNPSHTLEDGKCRHCGGKVNNDKDIFMYRGSAFCSLECRGNIMSEDEKKEKEAESLQRSLKKA